MFLGVNNRHASESKCNYFMAGEETKYVKPWNIISRNIYQSWTKLYEKNAVFAFFSKSHILWNIVTNIKKKNYTSEIY